MIQRIQTLHLIFAAIIGIITISIAISTDNFGCKEQTLCQYAFVSTLSLVSIVDIWSVFLFTNRKRQMRVVCTSFIISLIGLAIVIVETTLENNDFKQSCVLGSLVIAIAILNILAHKRIRYDDNLVKSADRLR